MQNYPIGKQGTPWTEAEKTQWFENQEIKRSYQHEVLDKLDGINEHFTHTQYGSLPIDSARYPLHGFVSTNWDINKPSVLVSGGVHGYETSGVQGAISFLVHHSKAYLEHYNLIIAPCVSPWGYETINRWNPNALDPNRSFYADSPATEALSLINFVKDTLLQLNQGKPLLAHIDLHETTDTDNSEFRPALAARDGIDMDNWEIPDGFYTVADTNQPQLAFQQALIDQVKKVTHIAPSDEHGKIIGADTISDGVICYDTKALYLCAGFSDAQYVTTTEVYPDSPNATPEICIEAQVAAIKGGLDYLISTGKA